MVGVVVLQPMEKMAVQEEVVVMGGLVELVTLQVHLQVKVIMVVMEMEVHQLMEVEVEEVLVQ